MLPVFIENKLQKLWIFQIIALILFVVLLKIFFLGEYNEIDEYLTYATANVSHKFSSVFSDKVQVNYNILDDLKRPGCLLSSDTNSWVYIGDSCNGRNLFLLYLFFLFVIPNVKFNIRLSFALLGIVLIFFANVLRVVLLLFLVSEIPGVFNLMHKFVFQILMYTLIGFLWRQYLSIK